MCACLCVIVELFVDCLIWSRFCGVAELCVLISVSRNKLVVSHLPCHVGGGVMSFLYKPPTCVVTFSTSKIKN